MKCKILKLFLLLAILFLESHSANAQIKETCLGNWKFEAPTAPDGFTYGTVTFKKDSVLMAFTDSDYRFPSNWIKVKTDSVIYESDINGATVLFCLKIVDKMNIKGNAAWSGGETPMILNREEDQKN
jgi:hypothetical protein